MNKPITIVCEDFKQGMTNLINNSGLPPFVLSSILQNYLTEVNNIARNEYMVDKEKYEKSLLKEDKEKEK